MIIKPEILTALSEASSEINKVSDELNTQIAEIDNALKNLNLGIACWTQIPNYLDTEIGYIRISKVWGISIRLTIVVPQIPNKKKSQQPEPIKEIWAFRDAPRYLRLRVVDSIPLLLEQLNAAVCASIKRLTSATVKANEMVSGINSVVKEQ